MIALRGIEKRFGPTVAVAGIDIEAAAGEIVGLIGENGAGKTTTLRILCGFMEPDAGQVEIDGIDVVAERRRAQKRIGYVPESAPLYPDMRVGEYLRFRAQLKGLPRSGRRAEVARVLDTADLIERERWLIGNLSRGLRQRVALADALLGSPSVLVFDEPTSGLDPVQVKQFVSTVRELRVGRVIVISSHVLPTLAELCDRMIVVVRGRVIASGDAAGLRRRAGLTGEASMDDVFTTLVRAEGR